MKERSNFKVCMKLIGLIKPLSLHMTLAVLMGLIGHLSATFITILGGYAILSALSFNISLPLNILFMTVCVLAISRGILHYGEQACNHFIAFKLLALIRNKVFVSLRKLCPAKLEGKDKGNLVSVITSDVELLEVFYAHTVSPIIIAFLMAITMIGFIGGIHPVLGAIALAAYFGVGVIIPMTISKLSGKSGRKFRQKSGEFSSFILDSLRGLSEVLQYGMGEKRLIAIKEKTQELSVEEEKIKLQGGKATAFSNSVILIFDIIMLFTAAFLFQNGQIAFEGVLISAISIMSSFGPVIALANLGAGLQNTLAAGNRVLDILEESPVCEDIFDKKNCDFAGARVENLSFSYDKEKILSDFSIELKPSSIVGIQGKSGSGKSTLLKLLMRFWNTEAGTIKISDRKIQDINTTDLRNMEGFVTQETHLFRDSIINNLRIANLNATEKEIETACKKASIHDFIMTLSDKYNTQVGELGDMLSGGERQRIGLARAFLHNAPLLLLDEPTSNLDSLNEGIILKSISEQCENKTVVLVSHRISTMRIADTICTVEHGRTS